MILTKMVIFENISCCCKKGQDLKHCPNQANWEYWRMCLNGNKFYKARAKGCPFVGRLPDGSNSSPRSNPSTNANPASSLPTASPPSNPGVSYKFAFLLYVCACECRVS